MSQLQQFRYLFPSLGYQLHKGEMGKLGVIGGSFAYTGAPYFAAMTAMKMVKIQQCITPILHCPVHLYSLFVVFQL